MKNLNIYKENYLKQNSEESEEVLNEVGSDLQVGGPVEFE